MNRFIIFPVYLLCFVLFLSMSAFGGAPAIGEPAPDFTLEDTQGNTHTLSDYRGKIVILEWINPNCPFVVRHYVDDIIPSLQRKYDEMGIVWLGINSTHPEHRDYETNESLNNIFTEWNAAYAAQLVDLDGEVGRTYDAKTTPHMYIIDKEGILVYNGAIDDDPRGNKAERVNYVEEAIQLMQAGKAIEISTTRPYGCTIKYTKDT